MVESALDSETHVRGFADRLGERFIVPQPSGSLLEHLQFRRDLASAPFFEPAVKERLARLANFRHATYTRARRLQRSGERGALVLVSTHVPGRHLSEILQTASRNGFRPPTPAVLWLTRQLLTSLALLHDYGPDVFHGAVGPERIILAGDGRVVVAEYVFGTAVEQAVQPWGVYHLWRELRLATLADFGLAGYGRRVDLLQVGLVTLAFLLGRPLAAAEFPEGLQQVIDGATEVGADGNVAPLGANLRSWIERMVNPESPTSFRSLLEGQKALAQLLQDGSGYTASSSSLQAFVEQCEAAPWCQPGPEAELPGQGSEPEAAAQPPRGDETTPASALDTSHPPTPAPARPSAAEPVAAPPPGEAQGSTVPASDAEWAPTPEPEIRTLFEAPPIGFGSPPEPPPAQERPGDAGGSRHATVHERPAVPVHQVPEPEPPPSPRISAASTPFRPPREEFPAAEPSAATARTASHARAQSAAPAIGRVVGRRRSPITPVRVGVGVGILLVVVLLAVALPRFWGGGSGPATGMLEVQSEPDGAEVTVDGRDSGVTPARLSVAPGAHKLEVRIGGSSQSVWVNVPEGGTLSQRVELPEAMERSGLRISTQPPGGAVSINGNPSGKAPMRVSDLQPGRHTVSVEGPFGTVDQEVQVAPGEVASVRVPTAGWVRVSAPFALEVTERGRTFGNTGGGPVMVPFGRHHFDLVNAALAVKIRQFVDVPPGETVQIPFEAPSGMMNLDADQPAEVFLDGESIGPTPLTSVAVPLGPHEVVFRHAKLGEVRYSVVVTLAAPVRLSVTFTKK